MTPAMALALLAQVERPILTADDNVLDSLLLAGLRAARAPLINPVIKHDTPDPWKIDYEAANTSEMCIVPGLHHSCICHGSVGYNVTLDTLRGISDLVITSFDSVHAVVTLKNLSKYDLTIQASLDDQSLGANGTAAGSIGACGITPTLHGLASADGNASGAVKMHAEGVVHKIAGDANHEHCMQIRIVGMSIPALDVAMSNIRVALDFGIFKIPISFFVSLFQGPLTRLLREQLIQDLPADLPAHINSALPCIPVI